MITFDKRIGSVGLVRYLPPGTYKVGQLEFADAAFIGNGEASPILVGIERKTLRDLVTSMETGRLSGHQLPGLLASYGVVYLIVEGIGRDHEGRYQHFAGRVWTDLGIPAKGLTNYLNTLMVVAGVYVLRSTNEITTANMILHLYDWWQKDWEDHRGHLAFCDPTPRRLGLFVKPGLLRRVAKELPGVGWERSAEVEKRFGSVAEMIMAAPHEWKEVPGIGKKMAENIYKELRKCRKGT